jgi:hypothetical protein
MVALEPMMKKYNGRMKMQQMIGKRKSKNNYN